MTLDELIQMVLDGAIGDAVYAAYDQVSRDATNARGQVLDVRTNAALDVIKRDLLMFSRELTDGGRHILESLLHPSEG